MQSNEVSTTRGQRIVLWFIAILMLVGTVGSFGMMVIANDNDQKDQARANELLREYQDEADRQKEELSGKYYPELSKHLSLVKPFDKGSVKEIGVKDIVVGTGDELTSDSSFYAYYIGWNPEGDIFDQSIEGESLREPYNVAPGTVISGWTEGVDGMKVGGVRELTIPSELAYGEAGRGEGIPPNTPLKFIIMVIPDSEAAQPEVSDELRRHIEAGRI